MYPSTFQFGLAKCTVKFTVQKTKEYRLGNHYCYFNQQKPRRWLSFGVGIGSASIPLPANEGKASTCYKDR
jgi:hypothetical protein